ncbi:MAG: gephyrin-like molybdotransferase Glp [Candidatus Thermoplasmatota archaeon]
MRVFRKLISLDEAKMLALSSCRAIRRIERVEIKSALNRVLAKDIVAKVDVPPYNRAAMDGYALLSKDTYGAKSIEPRVLEIVGNVYAGDKPKTKIKGGYCLKIATGAIMPKGADSVVRSEDTEEEGKKVKIFKPVYPNENVSLKGSDIKKNEILLKKGVQLDASKLGVIGAIGLRFVEVYEMPKVAIIPTGNEIVSVGERLEIGKVYDSNSIVLSSIVKDNGGIPILSSILKDEYSELEGGIKKMLYTDLLVVSGGSSVGEKDLLLEVIKNTGEVLFHGVRIRPGKPTICGKVEKKIIFGFPGYPTSSMVSALLFLVPVLRKIANLPGRFERIVNAKLSQPLSGRLGRKEYITVRVEKGLAIPVFKEVGAITSIANADGYIEIDENVEYIEKGEEVKVKLLV